MGTDLCRRQLVACIFNYSSLDQLIHMQLLSKRVYVILSYTMYEVQKFRLKFRYSEADPPKKKFVFYEWPNLEVMRRA